MLRNSVFPTLISYFLCSFPLSLNVPSSLHLSVIPSILLCSWVQFGSTFASQWFQVVENSRDPIDQQLSGRVPQIPPSLSPDCHPFLPVPLVTRLVTVCADMLACVAVSELQARQEFFCMVSITTRICPQFPQGCIHSSQKEASRVFWDFYYMDMLERQSKIFYLK